jgi:long-subunit acyl-CoA synthetase (AMP-forming)
LKAGTIGDRLRAVQPTLFLGVPRVWEKIAEKLKAVVAANPLTGMKLKVAKWSKGRGLQHQLNCQMVLPCLALIQSPRLSLLAFSPPASPSPFNLMCLLACLPYF